MIQPRYSNGVAGQPLYLTVSHLLWTMVWISALVPDRYCDAPETGRRGVYCYYLCRIILRGVEDCSRTVGEIIDMV